MGAQIFFIVLSVCLAVRLKRHPEKDEKMKKVVAEQRGSEYEAAMRKFLMVNYLTAALTFVLAVLFQIIFGVNEIISMWIIGCVLPLVAVITKLRFTGELSKFEKVFTAVWLVVWLLIGFSVYYFCVLL